jgi:DNA processing protein
MTAEASQKAFAAGLASLPMMTVHRLIALLRAGSPADAWQVVRGERQPAGLIAKVIGKGEVRAAWQRAATPEHLERSWQQCQQLGVDVVYVGADDYPHCLADDRQPPAVLFVRGRLDLLHGRRVALVGTRNATAGGRETARAMAADLCSAGVHVVSGLARGIDGAAHRGALQSVEQGASGRPIAVVASGPDVVYPREHRELWRCVAADGLLLSEAPPGTAPEGFRFPLRNRIIAALAELVVVVESRSTGGSLITVTEASDRGVPLMAVPGATHNRAAAGTNSLLRDGAGVVVDARDVLAALSIDHRRSSSAFVEHRARPRREDRWAYDRCADQPSTLDSLVEGSAKSLAEVAMSLARLEQAGWVGQVDGWFQAVGSPLR